MRMRSLPPLLVSSLGALLVVTVMTMHTLGMPMSTGATHGGHDSITAPASMHEGPSVSMAPFPCTNTHCVAARGGQPVAAQALPTATFVVSPLDYSATAPVVAEATSPSRAPPRSGSCSALCVWRQ